MQPWDRGGGRGLDLATTPKEVHAALVLLIISGDCIWADLRLTRHPAWWRASLAGGNVY